MTGQRARAASGLDAAQVAAALTELKLAALASGGEGVYRALGAASPSLRE